MPGGLLAKNAFQPLNFFFENILLFFDVTQNHFSAPGYLLFPAAAGTNIWRRSGLVPAPTVDVPAPPLLAAPCPARLHAGVPMMAHLARGTVLLAKYFSRPAGMNFVNELTNDLNDHWLFIAYQRHRTLTTNLILLSNTRTIAPSQVCWGNSHGNQSKPSGVIFWKS